jgi:hypothetical protein
MSKSCVRFLAMLASKRGEEASVRDFILSSS